MPSEVSERLLDLLTTLLADGSMQAEGEAQDGAGSPTEAASSDRGGIITGFTCYVEYVDAEGEPAWSILYAPDQRTVRTAGHVGHLSAVIDEALRRTVYYHDEP